MLGFAYAQDFLEVPIDRVALANEDILPPLRALDAGLAEHVEQLRLHLRRHILEVLAHRVELWLAGAHHVVVDLALLIQRVAPGRA